MAVLYVGILTALAPPIFAQDTEGSPLPRVYLDCNRCSFDYVRTEVPYVHYVSDHADADVYLRITDSATGSGREYTLDFRGIPPFSDRRETFTFVSSHNNTPDEERMDLVRHIRLGMAPFLLQTDVSGWMDISFEKRENDQNVVTDLIDPWNNWVFEIDVSTEYEREESELHYDFEFEFDAWRVTDLWKIELEFEYNMDRSRVELTDGTRRVSRDSWDIESFAGYSLSERFSLGLFAETGYARTRNLLFFAEMSPAVEYNFFSYQEYQERRLWLRYRITPSYRNYERTTIFLKDSERVVQQVLSGQLRYDRPWGIIDVRMAASNYMHDPSIYSLSVRPSLSIRVFRGLMVSFRGQYRIVNDQISLPAADITDTERLLGEREAATSYYLEYRLGLTYVFGSRYSNYVNSRF